MTNDQQQELIAKNLMIIGYNAWAGYLSSDRGALICSTNNPAVSMTGETFNCHYVTRSHLTPLLNTWLGVPDTTMLQRHFTNDHILKAVEVYNPKTEIILLLEFGTQVNFFYLKNLPVTPHSCYEAICKQWQEFPPSSPIPSANHP